MKMEHHIHRHDRMLETVEPSVTFKHNDNLMASGRTLKESKRLCEQSKTVDRLNRRLTVLLLRYHMPKPRSTSLTYASYADISRICKMPYSTVRNLCLRAIGLLKNATGKRASANKI